MRLQTLKTSDLAPIMRMVLSMAKVHIIEMLEKLYDPNKSIIECVRVDSVSGLRLREVSDPRYRLKKVVPVKRTPYFAPKFPQVGDLPPWEQLDDLHFDGKEHMRINGERVTREEGEKKLQSLIGQSFIMKGDGGLQKSEISGWLLIEYIKRGMTVKYLTTSHKALDSFRKKLKEAEEALKCLDVLCGYFHAQKQIGKDAVPDVIFLDEGSQISPGYYRKIHRMKERGSILVGGADFNQTPSVNGDNEIEELHDKSGVNRAFYDMPSRRFFRDLFDNKVMEKKWYEGICRNDKATQQMIEWVKANKRLDPIFKEKRFAKDPSYNVNMSFLRETKKMLNDKYYKEMEKVGLIGMSLTGIENKAGIINGRRYKRSEEHTSELQSRCD
jgi:hypothetical protein